MSNTMISRNDDWGLAEAAILSGNLLSAATLPDVLARPGVFTSPVVDPPMEPRRVTIRRRGPELPFGVHANRPMSVTLQKSIEAIADLLSLKAGWNSYSAKPIAHDNARLAIQILFEYLKSATPSPMVVPTVRGGIQLEWHTKFANLEIYVETSKGVYFFAEDLESGTSADLELAGHEPELRSWFQHISGK